MAIEVSRAARVTGGPTHSRVIGPGGAAYWLSAALAVTAAAGSLLTFTVPAVLRGTAVMNGSARGTALVVLLAGVPALACSMLLAARGSAAAVITWLGVAGFLLYNSLMFVFATPANRLFPLYLAMLALAAWSAGAVLWRADVAAFGALFSARTPVRGIAVYMWTAVALNAAAWLARIVPAVARGGAPGYLRGTGLTVNVGYVQDLALWLPLLAVAAAWLWRRRPWGYLLAGAGLAMWVLESTSIAVDKWYGHAAAPASPVASGALVPAFAALAVIGLIPAGLLLHGLSGGVPGVTAAPRPPAAARRGWHPWTLAVLDGLTGAAAVYGGAGLIRDGFGMPDGWLAGTPLTGWVLPGVALLIGVAVPQLAAAALIGAGARSGLAAGYLAGLLLVAWIAVELLILRRYFFLQPVIAGIGAAEVLLAWRWQRSGRTVTRAGDQVPASVGSRGDVRPCRSLVPARHDGRGSNGRSGVRIMRAVVVYESMYGNTHLIADAIGAGLEAAFDVRVVPVSHAGPEVIADADLVVVGGPTHVHGMSRASTRKAAVQAADKPVGGLTVEPDALGPGLREWFGSLGDYRVKAAAFDTRMHGPAALTGRAAKGVNHLLREHGFDMVAEPESFLVTKQDRLEPQEQDRARDWAAKLAAGIAQG